MIGMSSRVMWTEAELNAMLDKLEGAIVKAMKPVVT